MSVHKIIWKYPLEVTHHQRIKVPVGAKLLAVQVQNDQPCAWVIHDPDRDEGLEDMVIEMQGTGNSFVDSKLLEYFTTIQLYNGALVLHVFKEREISDETH